MGLITEDQLQDALETQRETKQRLGEVIIQKGYLTEEQLVEVLEFQLGIPHVNLYRLNLDPSIVHLIPEPLARRYTLMAVAMNRNKLTVAMADPLDFYAIEDVQMSTGFQVEPVIASREELLTYIERFYGIKESVEELQNLIPQEEVDLTAEVTDENSPVVRLVNQIIHQGVQQGASDIHIDPGPDEVRIRYRIDGILHTQQTLPKSMHPVLIARIKIVSNMNIAERRLPQDGRMKIDFDLRPVDIRVSTLPTVHGEKCVMRLLDTANAVMSIQKLGMSESNLNLFKKMIHSPNGIVLITGPTGSGKSSTLYAALNTLTSDAVNIITVEDPVEYQLPGINQVQVNHTTGLTFARGLRSILRQDPDIIMVGEIRDNETAEIAVRAALTGHLVLSTLHTNDAVSTISRLLDMGIEPFLVASSIVGVVAQRLVRRVCDQCAEPYNAPEAEQRWLAARGYPTTHLRKGRGCGHCKNTGYKGRLAIHEMIMMDEPLRSLVLDKRPDSDYRNYLQSKGFKSMLDDGLTKAAMGLTTVTEVLRVTIRD
jgi:type IV pilus assembly protein PilB